jgi:hypothetical protein
MWKSTSLQPRNTGRASERAGIVARRIVWADEAAAEPDYAAEAGGVTRGKFGGQAGPLGKTKEDGALGWDTGGGDLGQHLGQPCQGRGQPGLIPGKWSHKRVGIPGVLSRLRRDEREAGLVQLGRQAENVPGAGAAAMNQQHRRPGLGERHAGARMGWLACGFEVRFFWLIVNPIQLGPEVGRLEKILLIVPSLT